MMLTAQEEARLLQHDYVGTEHLLIAATEVGDGLPAVLAPLGLTTEALRGNVTRMVAPGGEDRPGELPLTAEARAAVERSLREALQLGPGAIRPAHTLPRPLPRPPRPPPAPPPPPRAPAPAAPPAPPPPPPPHPPPPPPPP